MNQRRRVRVSLLVVSLLFCGGIAEAQGVAQGRVTSDGTIVWRTDSSAPLATIQSGIIVEVTGQSTRWYEVRLPERVAGALAMGLIARSQVELAPGAPAPPMKELRGDPPPSPAQGARQTTTQPTAPRAPRRFPSGYVAFGALLQMDPESTEQVARIEANADSGELTTQYSPGQQWGFDAAVAGSVAGPFALGGAVDLFHRSVPGSATASVPHPFFFNTPRVASIDVTDLTHTVVGLHFQARGLWFVGSNLHVSVGGGPSLLLVRQQLVTDVTYTETYPYDAIALRGVETSQGNGRGLGFNADVDVAYYFTRRLGVGATGRYSRADVTIEAPDTEDFDMRAGGAAAVGVGLRVRF